MGLVKRTALGTASGFAAGALMDRVTTKFMENQSEESKQREKQIQQQMSTVTLVEKVAQATHREVPREQAQKIGHMLHVGFGVTGGLLAAALATRMPPFKAGLAAAMGSWLVVDEGLNYAIGLTPPATEYPRETHIRGLVGHVAYGLFLGALLAAGQRLLGARPAGER